MVKHFMFTEDGRIVEIDNAETLASIFETIDRSNLTKRNTFYEEFGVFITMWFYNGQRILAFVRLY